MDIGPITQTVRDAAVSFHAMAGHGSGYVPPAEVEIRGLRIGLPLKYYFDRLDLEVAESVRTAVQYSGGDGRAYSRREEYRISTQST